MALKRKSKIVSILLTLAMLFVLWPGMAEGADPDTIEVTTEDQLRNAVAAEVYSTIVLICYIPLDDPDPLTSEVTVYTGTNRITIAEGAAVTFGGDLAVTGINSRVVDVKPGAEFTLGGSASVAYTGGVSNGFYAIYNNGTVNINGGTVTSNGYSGIDSYSELTVTDGVISGGNFGIRVMKDNNSGVTSSASISAGTITGNTAIQVGTGAEATISGGSFYGSGDAALKNSGTATITGGTFTGKVSTYPGGTLNITCGSVEPLCSSGVYYHDSQYYSFLGSLPSPIDAVVGVEQTITLTGMESGLTYSIDETNTSGDLRASINNNKVNINPSASGPYNLVLTAKGLRDTSQTLNLTIPVTVTGTAGAEIIIAAIPGVTAPVAGVAPVTEITPTDQYTGTVNWSPEIVEGKFAAGTEYTATIILAPRDGYTLTGITKDFFTVAGATATNVAGSNIVSAVFPATAPTVSDDVCKIGETGYATLDAALDKVLDGQTITLLQNIDHSQQIVIGGKAVTFDLRSFNLNIDTSATAGSIGLTVQNHGKVSCIGSGKLNVKASSQGVSASDGSEIHISGNVIAGKYGVYTFGSGNPKVTIDGDVTVTGVGVDATDEVEAIGAGGNATVTIGGNVTANRTENTQKVTAVYSNGSTITIGKNVTTNGSGINVQNNGKVTIEGALNFDPTGTSQSYIKLGYPVVIKTADNFEATSSKIGYKEYSNGDNIVWIKDAVQLGTPTGLAWDTSGGQLKATWIAVSNSDQYIVEYYKDGVKLGLSTNVNHPSTSTDDMKDNLLVSGEGNYTFKVRATGSSYSDSEISAPSASYSYTPGETTYSVTVNGSYASLTGAGSYALGATVNIHAGNRTGYTFTGWSSDHVTITNADNKEASFTMPDKNVTVTANWSYNGGGGSSGSAAQPTVPAAGGAVRVKYTTSGGTAPLVLPASKVNEIIDKSEGSEAIIDLSKVSGVTSAVLPIAALSAFEEEGIDVTIELPSGTLTLDTVAAASVAEQATSSDLRLELKQVATSSLTEVQKQAIQSGDVIVDINIYSGTKKITNFDGTLTIQMPYDGPQPVAIWYLSDEGELENIPCTFKDGIVSFDLDHLSLYVVGQDYEEQPPSIPEPKLPADVVGHWASASIAQLIEAGIVSGYPDGSFQPDKNVTRAEFTVMLLKALKLEQKSGPVFQDTATHWAKDAIASAAAYGLVKGYDQNSFGPNDLITREQAAVMVAGAAKLEAAQEVLEFTDAGQISPWAVSGVAAAANGKILTGYPDNSFRPQGKLTRAEAAAIIAKLL